MKVPKKDENEILKNDKEVEVSQEVKQVKVRVEKIVRLGEAKERENRPLKSLKLSFTQRTFESVDSTMRDNNNA